MFLGGGKGEGSHYSETNCPKLIPKSWTCYISQFKDLSTFASSISCQEVEFFIHTASSFKRKKVGTVIPCISLVFSFTCSFLVSLSTPDSKQRRNRLHLHGKNTKEFIFIFNPSHQSGVKVVKKQIPVLSQNYKCYRQ